MTSFADQENVEALVQKAIDNNDIFILAELLLSAFKAIEILEAEVLYLKKNSDLVSLRKK